MSKAMFTFHYARQLELYPWHMQVIKVQRVGDATFESVALDFVATLQRAFDLARWLDVR